jgi:hypothetical protein
MRAEELPVRELFLFNKHSESIFEEYVDVQKTAVANGVAEVLDNLEL